MKTLKVFCFLLIAFFLASCTTSKKVGNRHEVYIPKQTKQTKPVRQEEPKEEKSKLEKQIEKRIAEQNKRKALLGLDCPLGGYEKVGIFGSLSDDAHYLGISNSTKFIFRRDIFVLYVKNTEDILIQIKDPDSGIVVENFCIGGSITLVKSIPPLSNISRNVFWVAETVNRYGIIGQQQSPIGILYNNNGSFSYRQDGIWNIKLNVIGGTYKESFDNIQK